MVQLIECELCSTSCGTGSVTVEILLGSSRCDHKHTHIEKSKFFFCSKACLKSYIAAGGEFDNGYRSFE